VLFVILLLLALFAMDSSFDDVDLDEAMDQEFGLETSTATDDLGSEDVGSEASVTDTSLSSEKTLIETDSEETTFEESSVSSSGGSSGSSGSTEEIVDDVAKESSEGLGTLADVTNVVLSPTRDSNTSIENLTVDYTLGDGADKGIINWYKDGTSLAVFNMHFEGNGDQNATDYSGNGHNGTAAGTPVWSSSSGYGGTGAYTFDSTDDYVSAADSTDFTLSGDYTVEAWINNDANAATWAGITGTYDGANGFIFVLSNYGPFDEDDELLFWAGGTWTESDYTISENGEWKHVVYTRSGSAGKFYVNGVLVKDVTGVAASDGGALHIGNGGTAWTTEELLGEIDDVRIYNGLALSPEQILAHYNNRTDLIVSQETADGDVWNATVTPNDGSSDGTTVWSNSLTLNDSIDTDGDTILDINDNCPIASNLDQNDSLDTASVKLPMVSATASAYWKAGYEASYAIDGSITGNYWNSGGDPPAWIYVDLGESRTIDEVRNHGGGTHGYYVQTNETGSWVTHATATANDVNWVNTTIDPAVTSRYVRFYFHNVSGWVSQTEIEIYGLNNDGVGDACDNCWLTANVDQEDSNANCPSTPFATNPLCGDVCEGEFTPPTQTESDGADSFNWTGYSGVTSVIDYKWHTDGVAKIKWSENLDLTGINNLNDAIEVGDGFVAIDSASYSAFANKAANITLEGVDCTKCNDVDVVYTTGAYSTQADIFANGQSCGATGKCSNFACAAEVCTFDVTGFTGYAANGSTELTINDSAEVAGSQENGTDVTYYAYYTNNSIEIDSATCSVTDPDGTYAMDDNSGYYNYTKSDGFSTAGLKLWNVTCNKTGYPTLAADDNITITSSGGGGGGSVPEFSDYAMILLVLVITGGFLVMRKRQ